MTDFHHGDLYGPISGAIVGVAILTLFWVAFVRRPPGKP